MYRAFLMGGAVPDSILIARIQFLTVWLPFRSLAQVQRKYSPATWLQWISLCPMPSCFSPNFPMVELLRICCVNFLWLIRLYLDVSVVLRLAVSRSRGESLRYSSHSLSIISHRSMSLGSSVVINMSISKRWSVVPISLRICRVTNM